MKSAPWLWILIGAAAGIAVELHVGKPGRESWDSEDYWIVGMPAMVAAAFVCALFARRRPLLVGYAPFAGQLIGMLIETGGGSMLPLGVIAMGIIGAPGVGAAFAGDFLGRRLLGGR